MATDSMKEEIIPGSSEQTNNRLLLVLICVIGAVSLVALILAAFSLSQKGTTNFNVGTTTGTSGKELCTWVKEIYHRKYYKIQCNALISSCSSDTHDNKNSVPLGFGVIMVNCTLWWTQVKVRVLIPHNQDECNHS